jgi:hypothetical protein
MTMTFRIDAAQWRGAYRMRLQIAVVPLHTIAYSNFD